jgi:hypothetical protein
MNHEAFFDSANFTQLFCSGSLSVVRRTWFEKSATNYDRRLVFCPYHQMANPLLRLLATGLLAMKAFKTRFSRYPAN